jgi:hypothetical protein
MTVSFFAVVLSVVVMVVKRANRGDMLTQFLCHRVKFQSLASPPFSTFAVILSSHVLRSRRATKTKWIRSIRHRRLLKDRIVIIRQHTIRRFFDRFAPPSGLVDSLPLEDTIELHLKNSQAGPTAGPTTGPTTCQNRSEPGSQNRSEPGSQFPYF